MKAQAHSPLNTFVNMCFLMFDFMSISQMSCHLIVILLDKP